MVHANAKIKRVAQVIVAHGGEDCLQIFVRHVDPLLGLQRRSGTGKSGLRSGCILPLPVRRRLPFFYTFSLLENLPFSIAHSYLVGHAVGDEVLRRQARLTPGRDKDEGGLGGAVRADGGIGGLVHGGHARAVVLSRKALDVLGQRHGAHRRLEVEEARLRDAEPVGKVVGVGQRGGKADNADLA